MGLVLGFDLHSVQLTDPLPNPAGKRGCAVEAAESISGRERSTEDREWLVPMR